MAKSSNVLRNIFGFFNLLFAIVGVIIIVLAVIAHVQITNVQEFENIGGVIMLYVIGVVTLSISFLGAYGAFRQVKWMLVVFLVMMCVGSLYLVRFAVGLVILRPKVSQTIQDDIDKLPSLDTASENLQEMMNKLQISMHCCGLSKGYADWNGHVPESCNCSPDEEATSDVCVALSGYSFKRLFSGPEESGRLVYKQPCGPIIMKYVKIGFDAVTGVFIGLTVLTVLGIVFSSCVIHQVNKNRNAGVVVAPPPPVFSAGPPKYQDNHGETVRYSYANTGVSANFTPTTKEDHDKVARNMDMHGRRL